MAYNPSVLSSEARRRIRKTLVSLFKTVGIFIVLLTNAHAGPLFDDYLNPVRPGPGTGPGKSSSSTAPDRGIGQTFKLPANTAEIYRIGVRPLYDSWAPDERVTLTLFDSKSKNRKLGEYSIEASTSRVQQYVFGNGSQFTKTGDRVLFFQLRVPVGDRKEFYFELTSVGGDGRVAFQAFQNNVYPDGEVTGDSSVADLSFEVHIKPVADKEANLRKFFFERLDLSRPELEQVKKAAEAGDWEQAIAQTVKHFHERMDLWQVWRDEMQVKIDPKADTSLADLILKGFVRHADTGNPIPWRKESWWAPEIPDAKSPDHGINPSPYLWHFDRALTGAYTVTGKSEYARAAIDLRMQWILDNPNPKLIYESSEFPYHHELWNDRTAAARVPGHADLVYARLYNFPGWTNDEKLVLFSFFEDNVRWLYKCTSGGNWGITAAEAALEFAIRQPEWKISKPCRDWAAARLIELSKKDVRGEGTSVEAAIKYHAMVARRLLSLLKYESEGKVTLSEEDHQSLVSTLHGMYDHMAHVLQPNSYVVMCGDSWYENYTDELRRAGELLGRPDFVWIATQGKSGKLPSETSKVYPEAGYFIMRSDFGGRGRNYADACQLFIHNGGWFGSHGHWDLTSVNLYGYGRTLIIDPGQYDYKPAPGIDAYWSSRIHSMLVCEGQDVKREPGPSNWAANSVLDWFDGRHFGYNHMGGIDYVRRRIAYVKPDYFLFDDSVRGNREFNWAQVWNLTDPNARFDQQTGTIETTFDKGGNVLIMNFDPNFSVERATGITATEEYPKTTIFRLTKRTANPRFQSLVYPYEAARRPNVTWERILPDRTDLGDLFYSVRVRANGGVDWAAFGESGTQVNYRHGKHAVNADFALVRMDKTGNVRAFAWSRGKELKFNGVVLAKSEGILHSLAVQYEGDKLLLEVREPDSTLAVAAKKCKRFVVNGKPVSKPIVKNGLFFPFHDNPRTLTSDDLAGFEKITKTNEWTFVPDPAAWSGGYTHHETDPGRRESGEYVFYVPETRMYSVEVFLPKVTITPSDRVEYKLSARMGKPVEPNEAIVSVREEDGAYIFVINQQKMSGWVSLGKFLFDRGQLKIQATNITPTDGLYFVADAVRLVW